MQDLVTLARNIDSMRVYGRVAEVNGLLIEAKGGLSYMQVGARCEIIRRHEDPLPGEAVGFREDRALMMPVGPVEGVTPGAEIRISSEGSKVWPTEAWLGRIVDSFGQPVD